MTETLEAIAQDLRAFSAAHPVCIRYRVTAGLGPPGPGHMRDFTHRGEAVRVLLTEEQTGAFWGYYLSVIGQAGRPLSPAVTNAVVEAFRPAPEARLSEIPAGHPYASQFVFLVPLGEAEGRKAAE